MNNRILQIIKSQLSKELRYINIEKESISINIKNYYQEANPLTEKGKKNFELLNRFRDTRRTLIEQEKKLIEALKSIKKQINSLKINRKVPLTKIEKEFGHGIGTQFKVMEPNRSEFTEGSIVKLIKSNNPGFLLFELVTGSCFWNNAPDDKPGAYETLSSARASFEKI